MRLLKSTKCTIIAIELERGEIENQQEQFWFNFKYWEKEFENQDQKKKSLYKDGYAYLSQ